MKTRIIAICRGIPVTPFFLWSLATLFLVPSPLNAQGKRKNPASKVYIADVSGAATIDTGEAIDDLTKRAVFSVQGSVIETKKSETASDRSRYFSTMVYSNGTGSFFDSDTRVEVKRFAQEPFTPNRADADIEPSISQTQAFVSRGAVGLCTSKLVAGSSMNYVTPHGSVNIRGRKVVIEVGNDVTKISMLEGESTVRGGAMDTGGGTLKVGEQALIRRGAPGQANVVEIRSIPRDELPKLDEKVAMACMAKKSVYFDVRERKLDPTDKTAIETTVDDNAAGSSADGTTFSRINAFDGGSKLAPAGGGGTVREIVPVEILPTTLPVEFTVSTASLASPGR